MTKDIHGNPIVIKRRDDGIHIDIVDENGCHQVAKLTDNEAMQLIRDMLTHPAIIDYLRGGS
jgi:hypothetical protein